VTGTVIVSYQSKIPNKIGNWQIDRTSP